MSTPKTVEDPKTFSSSKGVVIVIKPISQFKLDEMRMSKPEIPVPVYTAPIAGGGSQDYPLDEKIAKHKGREDEWIQYIHAKSATDKDFAKKFSEFIVWEGVDIDVPDQDSEWQKSSDYFGLKIPDNPIERKMRYLYDELLGTAEDIPNLVAAVLTVSQIDEEAVSKLRTSFRPNLERQVDQPGKKKKGKLENK